MNQTRDMTVHAKPVKSRTASRRLYELIMNAKSVGCDSVGVASESISPAGIEQALC